MPQNNHIFDRISLKKGELILNVIYEHTGQDNDEIESLFYSQNPLVFGLHIPVDGVYSIPKSVIKETVSEVEALLLWE